MCIRMYIFINFVVILMYTSFERFYVLRKHRKNLLGDTLRILPRKSYGQKMAKKPPKIQKKP